VEERADHVLRIRQRGEERIGERIGGEDLESPVDGSRVIALVMEQQVTVAADD
jgi:hypothetical protein